MNRWKIVLPPWSCNCARACSTLGRCSSRPWKRQRMEGRSGIAPFRSRCLFFTVGMIVAGFWQDKAARTSSARRRRAPRRRLFPPALHVAEVRWALISPTGFSAASASASRTSPRSPPASSGPPTSAGRSSASQSSVRLGLADLRAGHPSFLGSILQCSRPLSRTFVILGVVFLICVFGAARSSTFRPPATSRKDGTRPPPPPAPATAIKADSLRARSARRGSSTPCGLSTFSARRADHPIGQAVPLVKSIAATAAIVARRGLRDHERLQRVGRLASGRPPTRSGRKDTTIACSSATSSPPLPPPERRQLRPTALVGTCVVGFFYGGYLAMMPHSRPTSTAPRRGANYGTCSPRGGSAGSWSPAASP